jgi:hypothetical protein
VVRISFGSKRVLTLCETPESVKEPNRGWCQGARRFGAKHNGLKTRKIGRGGYTPRANCMVIKKKDLGEEEPVRI